MASDPRSCIEWLEQRRNDCDMVVEHVALGASSQWALRDGVLEHDSGKFFRVVAARAVGGADLRSEWQPLIDQPEVGLLGFLLRDSAEATGVEVLVQAKPEPGNVGLVQLAPSVQATRSNYLRVHGGRPTVHLDRFMSVGRVELSSSLQSEQGGRFLGKYNRNVTVRVDDEVGSSDDLQWFPFSSVQHALLIDFAVNTDARSVLVTTPWECFVPHRSPFDDVGDPSALRRRLAASYRSEPVPSVADALEVLDDARHRWVFQRELAPLSVLPGWVVSTDEVRSPGGELDVVHVGVECSGREVDSWDQPLMACTLTGEVSLVGQERDGVLRFLFCAAPELGFVEGVQFGPTTQVIGGPGVTSPNLEARAATLRALAERAERVLTVLQSDEGGRFMRCISRYSVALLDASVEVPDLEGCVWMSLSTVHELLQRQGVFTNEARSAVSLLLGEL